MSCKEKIDKVNGIQSLRRFYFIDKIYRNLPDYWGFDWQKINVVKSIPLPVANISYIKIKKSGPSSGSLHEKKGILLSVLYTCWVVYPLIELFFKKYHQCITECHFLIIREHLFSYDNRKFGEGFQTFMWNLTWLQNGWFAYFLHQSHAHHHEQAGISVDMR